MSGIAALQRVLERRAEAEEAQNDRVAAEAAAQPESTVASGDARVACQPVVARHRVSRAARAAADCVR